MHLNRLLLLQCGEWACSSAKGTLAESAWTARKGILVSLGAHSGCRSRMQHVFILPQAFSHMRLCIGYKDTLHTSPSLREFRALSLQNLGPWLVA